MIPAAPIPTPPPRRTFNLRVGPAAVGGYLAQLRIRKKLILLHTVFTLGLAIVLWALLKPAVTEIVRQAEVDEARLLLRSAVARAPGEPKPPGIESGSADDLGLALDLAARAAGAAFEPLAAPSADGSGRAVVYAPNLGEGPYFAASVRIPDARAAVTRLYWWTALALLGVYALVAAALELFVLPRHVYAPIRAMLDAEHAVQDGRAERELIPDSAIPADELGEIMRSRNASILSLRRNERALAEALARLEDVAGDLKKKNYLLEAARRNLADADRLASLGMMSAGIAHELNTPLAVLKGLVEQIDRDPRRGTDPQTSALMVRVVSRLERLGESLLDFARARPPAHAPTDLASVVDEAITLVRLDRSLGPIDVHNDVPRGSVVNADADRLVQVFVNLVRNAVDAIRRNKEPPADTPTNTPAQPTARASIDISFEPVEKDGQTWASVRVTDTGPGIDPEVLPRLFEPFASTNLDSKGTGLGLAVSDGIVREHGGVILARNRPDRSGSVFEVLLPRGVAPSSSADTPPRLARPRAEEVRHA